ncbi:MAG: outer membrane lipoprotein carrier protein LolA [Spirochaetaceae bacterium]|jgi:outer membrane lipoprotein-sorting protein|nr:outer membrane lipoprotein carrier protein LolA [Spirochaetaceae bacterium]
MFKRWLSVSLFLTGLAAPLFAQSIVTAEAYLERVSNRYASFNDYEAHIVIKTGGVEMAGTVSHLAPAFMRIDFSSPAEQVIVFNGDVLTIYLPEMRAILNQDVGSSAGGGASLATGQGLSMMRRNYAAAYSTGPDPEPLEGGSRERVVRLRLTSRYGGAGFRELLLSIDPETLLIRRIAATQLAGGTIQFDFTNVKTNQGIPEQRFIYDSPASANVYNNFLFRDRD